MKTLRGKLMVATAAASAVVLGLLGGAIYVQVRSTLYSDFDAALHTKAAALSAFVETDDGKIALDPDAAAMPEFSRSQSPDYFQLSDQHGHTLRSRSLKDVPLPIEVPGSAIEGVFNTREIELPGNIPGRAGILTFRIRPEHGQQDDETRPAPAAPPGDLITLVVARDESALRHTLTQIGWMLTVVCTLAIGVSTAILAYLVGRSLRVVDRLAGQLSGLNAADLSQQLSVGSLPAELRPIAETVNGLLARLAEAFDRERAFSADVAHELRTPLASLQTTLDVSLRRPRDEASYRASLARSQAITRQMRSLVDNLLTMARADSGQLAVASDTVDPAGLLRDAWLALESRAATRDHRVSWQLSDGALLTTDAEKLRLIVRNLFDNAVSYTPDGGEISISATLAGGPWQLAVRNSGCSLMQEQAERIFDRFWRADSARTDTEAHAGLGLSLCRRLAKLLGGQLTARVEGQWFEIGLSLPAGSGAAAAMTAR